METSLVPSQETYNLLFSMAKNASTCAFYRSLGGVDGVLSIMLLARELGIPPMQALSGGVWNINGKVELSARMINMLIRKAGHKLRLEVCNNVICKIWGKRKDTEEEMVCEFSIEEATRAGLVRQGSPWTKNPSDMLFARTISRLGRRLFPDVIGNSYVEGEIKELQEIDEKEETSEKENVEEDSENKFQILNGRSQERVEEFIKLVAINNKMPISVIKEKASLNPIAFWEQFDKWEKEFSQV